MARPPEPLRPAGNHVGYENVDRASVFEDGETRYWMNTRLERDRAAARIGCELGAQFDFGVDRLRREPRLHAGRTSTAPASRTASSSMPTTTRRAGRPTCGTWNHVLARRQDPGLLVGAARRLGGVRCLQRRLQAHLRLTTPKPETEKSSRTGSHWRPRSGPAPGAADQGAGHLERQRRGARGGPVANRRQSRDDRARAAVADPPRHDITWDRRARPHVLLRADPQRCQHDLRRPGRPGQRAWLRPGAVHQPALHRRPGMSGRSTAASSCSTTSSP